MMKLSSRAIVTIAASLLLAGTAFAQTAADKHWSHLDYLTELLTRFLHRDGIYSVRNLAGQPLEKLAEMWFEAEKPGRRQARLRSTRRETAAIRRSRERDDRSAFGRSR